jgi:hypothetical protein
MSEYESLGHIVPVPSDAPEPPHVYYLPHHKVIREESKITKLRVVFNGSSKSSTGVSLNDTRVRSFNLTYSTYFYDYSKMFRQIVVHPDDRPLQRIIWHNHQGQEQVFELTTVTYGTRSAPFLSGRVLQQLATDESEKFPPQQNFSTKVLKHFDFLDFSSMKLSSLIWCIVGCRIPSDEIFAER